MSCIQLILLCLCSTLLSNSLPNILVVMMDDLGWAEANFNRDIYEPEVRTPHMDALAADGLILERHYVHYECTPTRTSFQTGRLPYHVNLGLQQPVESDCGIPRRMTCIASKLKTAGYSTHMVGKWDVGMATPQHTPRGRGYDTSLIYFGHMNDYWLQTVFRSSCGIAEESNITDMWMNYAPATSLYSSSSEITLDIDNDDIGSDSVDDMFYEEQKFYETVLEIIEKEAENPEDPFFIVYASHAPHYPMQVPKATYEQFQFDDDESYCSMVGDMIYPPTDGDLGIIESGYRCRSLHHALVSYVDTAIGKIHAQLVDLNLWENTLFVFTTDNGGSYLLTYSAGNNYPLRGGKFTPWEGGIRGISFVSGGYLPESRRGKSESGIIHICDWYSTFCYLAGVNPVDETADSYDLPAIDSLNMWPLISGEVSVSPRTEIVVDNTTIIMGDFKYMDGDVGYAGWTGVHYPNHSSLEQDLEIINADCSDGCLYNLVNDISEYDNLIDIRPKLAMSMKAQLDDRMESYWQNTEVGEDSCPGDINITCGCWMPFNYWGGFFGPFQYMDEYESPR